MNSALFALALLGQTVTPGAQPSIPERYAPPQVVVPADPPAPDAPTLAETVADEPRTPAVPSAAPADAANEAAASNDTQPAAGPPAPAGSPLQESPKYEPPERSETPGSKLVPVGEPGNQAPHDLLGGALRQASSKLEGEQLPLGDALYINAYWDLATAVAEYSFALDVQSRLASLDPMAIERDYVLRTVAAEGAARVAEARQRVIARQHALAEVLGHTALEELPIAADTPLASAYETHFDVLFRNEVTRPPLELRAARRINQSLPLGLQAVQARTKAVTAADAQLQTSLSSLLQGGANSREVAADVERLGSAQNSLLDAVLTYNTDIGQYAVLVARDDADGSELLPMLIRATGTSMTPSRTATRTSSAGAPRTFSPANDAKPLNPDDGWVSAGEGLAGVTPSSNDVAATSPSTDAETSADSGSQGVVPATALESEANSDNNRVAPAVAEEPARLHSVVVPPRRELP